MRLRTIPDPTLRQRCQPIVKFNAELRGLAERMASLMDNRRGVGLAAPQAGKALRLFVFRSKDNKVLGIANPQIESLRGEQESWEGCLSIPGNKQFYVTRPLVLSLNGQNLEGEPINIVGRGYLATVLAHELDHLDGKLINDELTEVTIGDV